MKRLVLVIFALTGFLPVLSAQDTIVKTSGEEIHCRILKESEFKVYYYRRFNGVDEQSQINRSEISAIKYLRYKPVPINHAGRGFIGLGMGLDYGGFGVNVTYNPSNSFGLFVGAGYAFAGIGVNGGAILRLVPKKPENRVVPFITGMYGYNAAIAVKNGEKYNKMFYGPSAGFGIELRVRNPRINCWSFALLIPFRSSEVQNYIDDLKKNHAIEFQNELMPALISIGYKFSP